MYFVNWAMTGIVDITAVALYMHYWGAFGDVPQWVFALGALAIVGTMNMIGVKWFAEMEFWFALVKVLAIVAFLVVGTIFLGSGKPLDGNATGFHLITDNGGFFPARPPAGAGAGAGGGLRLRLHRAGGDRGRRV